MRTRTWIVFTCIMLITLLISCAATAPAPPQTIPRQTAASDAPDLVLIISNITDTIRAISAEASAPQTPEHRS